MRPIRIYILLILFPLGLWACGTPPEGSEGPPLENPTTTEDEHAIESVILELYSSVSFGSGGGPNWERFGALVRDDAIFLQAERGPSPTKHMDMEGFRQDWRDFMNDTPVVERGFTETVVRHQTAVFGNVAHSFVVFRPRIGEGGDRPATLGVDSIQLVKDQGRWWIASITTQFETPEWKAPEHFESRSAVGVEP